MAMLLSGPMANPLPPADLIRAAMVPELLANNLATSLRFWYGLCGFTVAYDRP